MPADSAGEFRCATQPEPYIFPAALYKGRQETYNKHSEASLQNNKLRDCVVSHNWLQNVRHDQQTGRANSLKIAQEKMEDG